MRRSGRISNFCAHWFGYLDVVGSVSSLTYGTPIVRSGVRCEMEQHVNCGHPSESLGKSNEIPCYLGYTEQCINIIAEIAHLIKEYCPGRLNDDRTVNESWTPSPQVLGRARHLIEIIEETKNVAYQPCLGSPHGHIINGAKVNLSYYEAALVQLYRRVLNRPTHSTEVQAAVTAIIDCIESSQDRSVAFMAMPLCTAAVEALDPRHRQMALSWMSHIEQMGFATAKRGRELCERVYKTGRNWEALWNGEYMG